MNGKLSAWGVSFLLLILASEILAGEPASKTGNQEVRSYHWNDKLGRGALNIITFPLELVRQFHFGASEDTTTAKRFLLIFAGFGKTVLRLGAGVVELMTFPLDFPTAGKTPLMEPEFVWE